VTESKMLKPSKLFIFYCKYSFRDWSKRASLISKFSKLNE
jgi:hypothetical protein